MKKTWIIFSMLAVFGLSSSAQLKVVNNFGQDLNVENSGKTIFVPNKGTATFATRSRIAMLSCTTIDNRIKFVISREVSRSGLVTILASDGTSVTVQNSNPTEKSAVAEQQSLDDILNSGKSVSYTPATTSSVTQKVIQSTSSQNTVTQSVTSVTKEQITIEYSGQMTLKILSSDGQGLELIGKNDTTYSDSTNKYNIFADKNADLIIGVGEKKQNGQSVWPYGEIRKRIKGDAICKINDADIQMMSTSETKKLRFKVDAKDYKILIKSDDGLISLSYRGISKQVELPIGQSYVRIAYTDPQGVFHPTAFMSVHVTDQDRYISITANDLAKTFTINNW